MKKVDSPAKSESPRPKKLVSSEKKILVVFTDGSCLRNGRMDAKGGIGIHFPNKELKDISKPYEYVPCTNQRTELFAILYAFSYIEKMLGFEDYKVIIKTDSLYSINCITRWVNGWLKNNWKTSTGDPVKNREYIEPLYEYYRKYDIDFIHIEAHTGKSDPDSVGNAIADQLANDGSGEVAEEPKKSTIKIKLLS